MGGGGGGGPGGAGGVERDYKLRHHLNLCLRAQMEMKMKKVVGVIFPIFFFYCVVTISIQQWPTTKT